MAMNQRYKDKNVFACTLTDLDIMFQRCDGPRSGFLFISGVETAAGIEMTFCKWASVPSFVAPGRGNND